MKKFKFDRAYYDRWYRNDETRTFMTEYTPVIVRFVLAYLDYLEVEVKTVLDAGCGLGHWGTALKNLGRDVRYHGLETSDYLCRELGWEKGLHRRLPGGGTLRSGGVPGGAPVPERRGVQGRHRQPRHACAPRPSTSRCSRGGTPGKTAFPNARTPTSTCEKVNGTANALVNTSSTWAAVSFSPGPAPQPATNSGLCKAGLRSAC